ncbi:MAG: pyruvate ferredoxin oxidoreductase [Tindallia sp. MSAO_Bac2]|nr:MAG: pyruvate ferredoxin oxidoreductase [Tindallia sp. MSAO_Bac2]
MPIRDRMSGNEAVALAMKQINPDVLAAFPITPSTEIPQIFSQYVSDQQVDSELILVESEHSAMSACIGSQSAGARTMTATSSAGLALMWEMLYVAASNRLPITMAVVNRALSGPININADHSDSMGARDSGWIQIYSENNQEAYDNYIQAVRIAEHPEVQLPVMVCQDGFITSHSIENIELLEDESVKSFVSDYSPAFSLLNSEEYAAVGPYDSPAYYMEHKRQQAEAMKKSLSAIREVSRAFESLSGRKYDLFESYRMEDAELAIVIVNSAAGTAKEAVDRLRKQGKKAGLVKIRVFRPFPHEQIAAALSKVKVLGILDRSESFSSIGGPLFAEIRAALYPAAERPPAVNYIYGLGGRDVTIDHIESVFADLEKIQSTNETGQEYRYLGLRE